MSRIEKVKGRTLRALMDGFGESDKHLLRDLFRRLLRLVELDPDVCYKAEWRLMVGLHSAGGLPAAPAAAATFPGGAEVAEMMRQTNAAYDTGGTGRQIFSEGEIDEMAWAELGEFPPGRTG